MTAVVTGAARGIGRAILRRLIADGHRTVAVDVDAELLAETCRECGAQPAVVDVTDRDAVSAFAEQVQVCDVLVNNAGIWRFEPLLSATAAREVLQVNLLGPLNLMQALTPAMPAGGAVVNVSSVVARRPVGGLGLYPVSKAALEALTRTAALELGPRGIRCNAVGPGFILTDGTSAHLENDDRASSIPLRKIGHPDEVAAVVSFLCSDEARYVTGQIVYVDGGYG
ncbi:3-oxoacyl-[acyl-carrier protein] reductase [Allocatelliglobosispora scoriae]|uniref:3-oxoacyl-[acyl-carrier protein] reductase n=1 Tax=Allocatelliglobosispora scoriae TaxID=643052 RepID=A0A841BJR6_9ACTN|nr:SDR family oxidoreductase [Allocatelliglobosispora scoriae]MBB5867446.1 3-oxoacyl-[acyl-carrier protein] reductase [Allocatelliglobosispora scoriae]